MRRLNDFAPESRPLRPVRKLVNQARMANTLIQDCTGHKSLTRKDGARDDTGNFKNTKRNNDTHDIKMSTTDAVAWLHREGNTANELRFMGHTLSDNCHGLIASDVVTKADGYAEREATEVMITDAKQVTDEQAQITLAAYKQVRRSGAHWGADANERGSSCGAEHQQAQVNGVRPYCSQRGLRYIATKAQTH